MDKRKSVDNDQQYEDDEDGRFKSKNLNAERRRRKKLSDRQLELRSLVPNITNATPLKTFSHDFFLLVHVLTQTILLSV